MTRTTFPRAASAYNTLPNLDGGFNSFPIQPNALNAPTLVVQEGGVDTHAEDEPADLNALVEVDDSDGFTTTDVELYVNAVLISSMVDDGGGSWSLALPDVAAGTKDYRAKRITADGVKFSNTWQVVVSPVATGTHVIAGAGNQVIAGAGNNVLASS